ncbi:MAG: MraY family glycosyltransferase [Alphaproteobacteria bacterium]|nr:MraY family glycosyltransferase [Alphaproteobacteria bacterium]
MGFTKYIAVDFKIFVLFLTALIICVSITPILIKVLKRFNLTDDPEWRKIHKSKTPTMGGIGFIFASFISILIWVGWKDLAEIREVFLATFCMILVGIRDDSVNLRPLYKLFVQIFAAELVINTEKLNVFSFININDPSIFLIILFHIATLIFIIGLTNASNLIDGIDGLAGTYICFVFSFLGFWFLLNNFFTYALCLFAFTGGVVGFLVYNWQPAKIFMGDTGSLPLGFILSIAILFFVQHNLLLPESIWYKFNNNLSILIAVIYLPALDTFRVMFKRIVNSKSPFLADKNHLHHILVRVGFSHKQSTITLVLLNFVVLLVVVLLKNQNEWYSILFLALISVFIIYFISNKFLLKRIVNSLNS